MYDEKKVIKDIIDLEKRRMNSILKDHGIEYDSSFIEQDINKSNPGLQNILYVYDDNGRLLGFLRFNFDPNKDIIIKSIQIDDKLKPISTLKELLKKSYNTLLNVELEDNARIYLWTNTKNHRSIVFLEKLGFKYHSGHRDASRFEITKKLLLERLSSCF